MSDIKITNTEMRIAKQIAKKMGYNWRMDNEDIEQQLMVWMLENQKYVLKYRQNPGDGQITKVLKQKAAAYCAEETIKKDEVRMYTKETVKNMLKAMWDTTEEAKADSLARTGRLLTTLLLIENLYKDCTEQEQLMLALRFRDDLTYAQIGKQLNISTPAAQKRTDRLLEKMTNVLGGHHVHKNTATITESRMIALNENLH